MINITENIEDLIDNNPSQLVIDGLTCIHLIMDIAVAGNEDLINAIENGR